ncbi:MAG: N-acetylmuramoyl-L-alanine amidase [Candidatus Firestonebacteria bacterium]
MEVIKKIFLFLLLPGLLLAQSGAVNNKTYKVVLDAGHGGYDGGAVSVSGGREKDYALEMVLLVQKIIEDRPDCGVKALLTRSEDKFVTLLDRVMIANQADGDFFISFHVNSSQARRDSGFEVYYYDSNADSEAGEVAKRENEQFGRAKEDKNNPMFILWDLAQNEFLKESAELCDLIQSKADEALNKGQEKAYNLRNRGIRQANFLVLTGMKMPSVLLELGFISNQADEEKLKQKEFKERYAAAIADAIIAFKEKLGMIRGKKLP